MEKQYTPEKRKEIPNKEMKILADAPKAPEKTEKPEEKKIKAKKAEEKAKKTEALVSGKDLGISLKHSMALCNFIKGRKLEEAIFLMEEASKMKRAIPMKGEIGHRKGMAGGRYPIKAAGQFVKLLKQLSANASVNGLDLDKARIECIANNASRPFKRFGSERFKRTHVILSLKEKIKEK